MKITRRAAIPIMSMLGLLLSLLIYLFAIRDRLIPINDISTDLQDPPTYHKVISLRSRWQNSPLYPPEFAAIQKQVYADIRPLQSALSAEKSFALAQHLIEQSGWILISSTPEEGMLEATAITPILRFRDDVVIRIRPQPAGSLLDMRSSSRLGRSDLGVNAARIRAFMHQFSQQAAELQQ